MAKIGTAHIEIKPTLDEDGLAALTARIEEAVAQGVMRGMAALGAAPAHSSRFVCHVPGCTDPVNHVH